MAYRMGYSRGQGFSLGPIGFLIIANLILWIATSVRPELFIPWLGLSKLTFASQPWTIVTNMFVHAPFPRLGHILANMFTLFFFGNFLTRLMGEKRFFTIYFGGGLLGNILYLMMSPLFSIAFGASGAVFAVAGALAFLRPKQTVFIFPIPAPIPLWIAVVGGFVILSFFPGVAWQAHLGGLLFGLGAGYIFKRKQRFYI